MGAIPFAVHLAANSLIAQRGSEYTDANETYETGYSG